ncbi:Na(+)-translocating NADH-quinone reductase subunit C [Zunongwangia atlantica]|uniref:Na(+)-translocating NADH-quinone reductase subunit C n=1 Tax=Zunongwangia atlantica 22II14-10F7 TaxID=1185767 RepID=A0A1Y1T581_9FLAO|nr:Na(+)-translocating NADH-quinone reductase subunit C [Zunongwangia atlantica]ORL46207.1 Na(+)-translocating NADH-quinone reductase subunit C [Zunongwangia atlantica 22II14-10F7]
MEEKKVNKTNTNGYTFIFAIIMVLVVASVLAFTATSLKPLQNENVRNEKMQNILATVGIETSRDSAQALYDQYITETVSLKEDGSVDESIDAFEVDLTKELRRPVEEQVYPLYIADIEGSKYYIIPLRGKGLWDAIWGYISLKDDVNTVKGAVFDHKGETPGLGAEITQVWFQERFADEKIFDENGNLVGVSVVKGSKGNSNKDDNQVDAISGATITGNGVSEMISERLQHYLPYFKQQTDVKVATK